ncbi:hypothetical protein E4U33_001174 [Claviceps sp. LM78 group G4]|nr:hypothetical protein E4U33_001174 [Claviceps sp. LM78 group G4]
MASTATEQPPRDDPHRLGVPIMPRPGHRPKDHRQCLKCRFFKPLQDFEAWRKKGQYVTRCVACRKEMQSSSRASQAIQGIRGVSGTKRSIGEVDGPQKPRRYVHIAAKPPQPSPGPPQKHCTPTPRYVPLAAQPWRLPPISHTAPFQTGKPQKQGPSFRVILPRNDTAAGHASQGSLVFQGRSVSSQTRKPQAQGIPYRAILPRNATAAGHPSQGSSVFQGRGVRSEDTPVVHPARQDRDFTSWAQPSEARDDSVPSPSRKTTTTGPKAMTAGPNTTTAGPKTMTARLKTTTAGPKTTTAGPKTTTTGPDTTTAGPKTTTAGPKAMTTEPKTTTVGPKTTATGPNATTAGHDARTARVICHLSQEHEAKSLADEPIKTEK